MGWGQATRISQTRYSKFGNRDQLPRRDSMDIKTALLALTPVFVVLCLFFGTRNGFYDSDNYHGNGSAH